MTNKFKIDKKWKPKGDQPKSIKALAEGVKKGMEHQTLLGITGSGKTFAIAGVVEKIQKPTLVIAHNKTLAAQLAQEFKDIFPDNAVHYFVSYYDYYQPEAYIAHSDTYIEKDAQTNDEIDRLRHASTQALLTRKDTLIVASVSAIYGLGSPQEYLERNLLVKKGQTVSRSELMRKLITIYFERTNADLTSGTFRAIGNTVEVVPAGETHIYRFEFAGNKIGKILILDAVTRKVQEEVKEAFIFPAKHFVTPEDERKRAIDSIKLELKDHLTELKKEGKLLEIERLRRRTNFDIRMIEEVGYCNGIENYSRHLAGKNPGEPPETLLSYFPKKKDGSPDFLTVIDESHMTIPQLRGMYEGDASRKRNLVKYGFRLPSALDNRPLQFPEFNERVGQLIYASATPGDYEIEQSAKKGQVVEQIIRPTGLIDPEIEVRGVIQKGTYEGQIEDLINEVVKTTKKGERSLATTLTKKMAEDLSEFLKERGIKSEYLHSEIVTLERIKILTAFRRGDFDCLVGVNLLREGLDLPEVSFIGILDADKEGFLRSETSLIQTIGRAARNVAGRVILYGDTITGSMKRAIEETQRRRKLQIAYNKKHGITPQTIKKEIGDITSQLETEHKKAVSAMVSIDKLRMEKNPDKVIKEKEKQMNEAVKVLDFETAALLRDEIKELEKLANSK
ncbi:excinuclease ABC subunit B [bacterium]|nr:excinuclease ABC subunit B [bacterium]